MIKITKYTLGTLLAMVTFTSFLGAASNDMSEYHSLIIDNFNNPTTREWTEEGQSKTEPRTWTVKGSMNATEGTPELKHVAGAPSKKSYSATNEGESILGVRAKFNYKGYNYFEITPMVNDEVGFMLPGNTRAISVWVWGSNFNYTIEAQLADHNGKVYTVSMGSLQFLGWRNLTIRIPRSMTEDKYAPWGVPLKFLRFVVRTSPSERVHDFQIYLDELRVQTVKDQSTYNGGELFNPDKINELWNNGQ